MGSSSLKHKVLMKFFCLLGFVELSSLIILVKKFLKFDQQITMLESKCWGPQASVAKRDNMFMGILTLVPLFIDQILKILLPKWSTKRALQNLKGKKISWEPYVLVMNYPWKCWIMYPKFESFRISITHYNTMNG